MRRVTSFGERLRNFHALSGHNCDGTEFQAIKGACSPRPRLLTCRIIGLEMLIEGAMKHTASLWLV